MRIERKVLVIEDDAFLNGILTEILEARGFITFQAGDAESALELIDTHYPDALIVDLDLGQGPSGLEVIGALGDRVAEFGVLILSNYPSATALAPGSSLPPTVGYLMKRKVSDPDEIVNALEAVLSDVVPSRPDHRELVPTELAELTAAQFELLRMIALGYSNDMIARERGVTVRSVETMVNRLFTTLGLSADSRSNARVKAAMLFARTMGIPRTEPPS
jgi:DNA-binding NarL/FixJ family response regulator